jgi:ferredoxin-type protein NapF
MYTYLKKARVALSVFFMIAITAAFIFFVNRESPFFSFFLKLQFVPSLLGVFSGGLLVFVILLALTFLFGRVYCSTLCPVGTYQDVVSRIAYYFKTKKKRRFKFSPVNNIRYIVFGIVVLFVIGGITLPLGLLDPYSNWGRVSNEIISRSEQLMHNGVSFLFPDTVFYRSYAHFTLGSFLFALAFLLLVTLMSAFRGRLYCNTICPVGTLLGLLSRLSLYKPAINRDLCTRCQACVMKCKSQCIDLETQTIDESRCVGCLDCMVACKNGGISYLFSYKKVKPTEIETRTSKVSQERRSALIAIGLLGTAMATKAMNLGPLMKTKPKPSGIMPPCAADSDHFKRNCTACHACIAACPNNIIKPATNEYGLDGVLLPVLSFKNHFCSYECNECALVCPNDALMPLLLEEKQVTAVGKVNFFQDRCIVKTDGTDCGACDEHCPTKAITMVPFGNDGLYIPKVNGSLCIGCGACEYICPAIPQKAMVVQGLPKQVKAKKPSLDKQEKIEVDDFGF